MKNRLIALACAIATIGWPASVAAAERSLLLKNARVIDGAMHQLDAPVSILIRDGRIAQIAIQIEAPDVPVLDVSGRTVIPGLIDAHVHVSAIPGAEVRGDSAARRRTLRAEQLRSYLACGVTTVLDAASDASDAGEVHIWLAAGHAGPTVLTLGPPIAAPGGYMSTGPGVPIATIDELDRLLDLIVGLGAIGIKVPLERGFGHDAIFPVHPAVLRDAIKRKAAERDLPIFVHASDEIEHTMALDMGARGLMHVNFAGTEPTREFIDRAVRSGAYMVTTFSIIDAGLARWHPERLEDPLVKRVVPLDQQRMAASQDAWVERDVMELGHAFPSMPETARRLLAWWSPPEEKPEVDALAVNLRAARALHQAGVPLAIGSDAGNSSLLSQFHGTSTLRELELLAEAGVPNGEVLAAATRVPARMLRIESDAGSIAVGRRGDLVVLDGDPLVDFGAIRQIRWTIKGGDARTPAEWMRAE
jgi:imidazolonepropionase-like amidohydrolase